MKALKLAALALVAAALATPAPSQARPGGGSSFSGGHGQGGGHYAGNWGGHRGGYRGWNHGWGYRGWGPGPFWGGIGLGIGLGAIAYSYSDPWYGQRGYYPVYGVAPVVETVVVEPQPGDRVVRSSGRPVPLTAPAPDPIFYPKNGQPPERIEADRQDCNRWATTQAGAMSDASIFQRATFACMEGRGYTVR